MDYSLQSKVNENIARAKFWNTVNCSLVGIIAIDYLQSLYTGKSLYEQVKSVSSLSGNLDGCMLALGSYLVLDNLFVDNDA